MSSDLAGSSNAPLDDLDDGVHNSPSPLLGTIPLVTEIRKIYKMRLFKFFIIWTTMTALFARTHPRRLLKALRTCRK